MITISIPQQSSLTSNQLISIIVPVYNVAPYLDLCIESILKQTYKNIEILLIVSKSDDNSVEICESYISRDSRISVIQTPAEGLSKARNDGIEIAKGEWLSFIDSDDFITYDFIEKLHTMAINSNSEIAQCSFLKVSQNTNSGFGTYSQSLEILSGRDACNYLFDTDKSYETVVAWGKIYRKELFDGIRYPVGRIHEDVATTHKLLYRANRVVRTDSKLYFYRQNETSILGKPYSLKRLDTLISREERLDFFKESGDLELYSRAQYEMINMVFFSLENVKRLPNTRKIQNELKDKRNYLSREILKDNNIPNLNKIYVIIRSYFPRASKLIVNLRKHIF